MKIEGLPRFSRLGVGVVLDAQVIWSLRVADDPGHERVKLRVVELVEAGFPLVVSYLSLAEASRRTQAEFSHEAAIVLLREAYEIFNIVLPDKMDVAAGEGILAEGAEGLTLEQAVAGSLARRLDCSVYGSSPAYHLLRVAVVID